MVKMSRRSFMKHVAVGTGTVAFFYTGLQVQAAEAEVYTLRIIHTNDHHARIEPVLTGTPAVPLHGGVSRRKTLIDSIRSEGGNQILVDAGDVFQGTLWFNQYNGLADLEFYNDLGYEVMTIGNHEYDKGQQPLADFIKGANFPVLSANTVVDSSSVLSGLIKPWIIKEVGGEKIGIFGLTTDETAVLSSPGPGISFTNYIEAARTAVAELKAQGVNKIIALTHVGITFDRELAAQVDGISVIIGGHSHTPMGPQVDPVDPSRPYPEVIASPSGKPTVMATDWEWGRWLGDLTIGFDANGDVTRVVAGSPHEVLPSITPNQGYEDRIAVLAQPLVELRNTVVGEAAVALNGARGDVRTKETNLGNLISDAMLDRTTSGGAQIALMNGGSIRTSIDVGPVTLGEVLEVQPFGNTLVLVTLTGEQFVKALENGVSQVETVAGRFPQVAGARYSFDPSLPVNSRITGVQVKSGDSFVAIDPAASYRVVTNNYLLTGGDGYSVLVDGSNKLDTGLIDADVTADYITAHSPVSPTVEGRIVSSGTLPGAESTPSTPSTPEVPAQLPNTAGGAMDGLLWLAAGGASAIAAGLRLRSRSKAAEETTAEETAEEEELVEA